VIITDEVPIAIPNEAISGNPGNGARRVDYLRRHLIHELDSVIALVLLI